MTPRLWSVLLPLVLGLVLLPGCGLTDPKYAEELEYPFSPHPIGWDDAKGTQRFLSFPEKSAWNAGSLGAALKPYFGTPRKPLVKVSDDLANDPHMQLQAERLEMGSMLYRRYCLHCHGLVGDGNGPTGQFLFPKPRDYRQGIFKFRSTESPRNYLTSPARDDLLRTVRTGIPGSAMPSFNTLSEDELQALVSYVIHLALRGQTEYRLIDDRELTSDNVEDVVNGRAKLWLNDSKAALNPKPSPPGGWEKYAKDLDRGRQLFLSDAKGQCAKCHGLDGRASPTTDPRVAAELNRKDIWGQDNPPRNFRLGMYRGGSRPVDVYHRIKVGIIPSPSGMSGAGSSLNDEEIWYLTAYVLSLSQQP